MNYDRRPGCPSDRHDSVRAAKHHHCTCPAARAARNAQQRRQRANRAARSNPRAPRKPSGIPADLRYALTIRRITNGLRQQDVAAELGVNERTVRTWERGQTTPSAAHLAAWKTAVGWAAP